ncbi:MAG: endolytic transglycosylase MltG [Deltaproteobacteria bacterium]|nr:MAG: endolytic transglycosylase MltG [Deltaproteobacteria bacterium]
MAGGGRPPPAAARGHRPGGGHADPPGVPGRPPLVIRSRLARGALALTGAGGLGIAGFAVTLHRPGPPVPAPVAVTVDEGERFADVAADLARQGVLRHPLPLVVWARVTRQDRGAHWGEYLITRPLSPLELLARITGPPDPLHAVVVPEGRTLRDVVGLLAAAGFGSEESFLCVLQDPRFLAEEDLPPAGAEGYLFPDTYAFPLATPQERILRSMVQRFRDVFTPALMLRAADLGLSVHQAVTLASLVESETPRAEERRLVAAVFLNRLRRGIPLQSDPTVLYGREGRDRTLTRADLHRPTPFNTYTIPGLPPGPIANPGRASLEAAVDPAPVDYLYFVARGDGTHTFSSTLAAHNAAVAHLRRVRR